MNKILIGNEVINEIEDVKVDENIITFNKDGIYEIEYVCDREYDYTYVIYGNITLYESSFDKSIVVNNHYIVKEGSLTVIKFYNNLKVDEKIDIDLCSEGTIVNYNFINICRYLEHYEININHNSKGTKSNINNKSVALDLSKIKFVINSNVSKESVKSVLNQNTRIVTIGDACGSISPNMFIDLDDVEARHGSVIGTFKDDQVFYLMSKGISYNEALKLLIKGYILSEFMGNYELRKEIVKIIDMYWR